MLYLCTVVRFSSGTQYFQPCQKCVTCAELHSPVHRYSTFDISYVFNEEFYKVYKKNGVEFKPVEKDNFTVPGMLPKAPVAYF